MDEAAHKRREHFLMERKQKRVRAALRLRDLPPERTVQKMFQLMRFTKRVSEAAENVQQP